MYCLGEQVWAGGHSLRYPEGDATMFSYDNANVRPLRHAKGTSAREPFSGQTIPPKAIEMRWLEQLPWPRNLFAGPASIAELVAGEVRLSERAREPEDA